MRLILLIKKRTWLVIGFSLLLCAALLKVGGSYLLGRILERVFAQGTGCTVRVEDPELFFFPISGRIHNASIRCPEESENEGFTSGEISVRLTLSALFNKRVELQDLFLKDTRVISLNEHSAFINTLDFLFSKNENVSPTETWHSKLTSGWKAHVKNVEISTSAESHNGLVIGVGHTKFFWDQVKFVAVDERKEDPTAADVLATNFRVQVADSPEIQFGRAHIKGGIGHGQLLVENATVDKAESLFSKESDIVGVGTGVVNLNDGGGFQVKVSLHSDSEYLARLWPRLAEFSELHPFDHWVEGEVSGEILNPQFEGQARVQFKDGFQFVTREVRNISSIETQLKVTTSSLQLDNLTAGEIVKDASIRVGLSKQFPLTLVADFLDFSINGSGELSPLSLNSQILLRKENGATKAHPISLLIKPEGKDTRVELQDGLAAESSLGGMTARNRELRLVLNVNSTSPFAKELTASASNYPLQRLTTWTLPLLPEKIAARFSQAVNEASSLDARVNLKRVGESLVGSGFAGVSGISPAGFKVDKLSLASQFSAEGVDISDIRLDSVVGPITGNARINSRGEFAGDLTSKDFHLKLNAQGGREKDLHLKAEVSELPLSLFGFEAAAEKRHDINEAPQSAGYVDLESEYSGPLSNFLYGSGYLRISKLVLGNGASVVEPQQPLEAELSDGRLLFKNVALHSGDKEISLTGYLDKDAGWQGVLKGRWDLSQMVFRRLPLEQVSGAVETILHISGRPEKPILDGKVLLSDGAISFPLGGTFVGANDISATANVDGNNLTITNIKANVGEGTLSGVGYLVNVFPLSGARGDIRLHLDDIVLEPISHLIVQASGIASLHKSPGSMPVLSGDISVTSATYEDNIELRELVKLVSRKLSGTILAEEQSTNILSSDSQYGLILDVAIHATNGIVLDTNVAQAELGGEIRLSGLAEDLTTTGELRAIEGVFGVERNRFEIVSGKLTFPNNTRSGDPQIDLIGEAVVRDREGEDQRIRILLTGAVSNPEVRFTSDTGLREQQIVSLLGVGANFGRVSLLKPKGSEKSVAQLLSPLSGVSVAERVSGLTEFSDVRIDTYTSPHTGEVTPIVSARRRLIDDVDLEVSSELSGEQVGKARVTYPLTNTIELNTGWSSRSASSSINSSSGSFNAGVRYRKTFPGLTLVPQWLPKPGKED